MVDEAKLHQFIGQMLNDLGGAVSIALVRMGDALGLYKTLHQRGPMTIKELATEAGVNERYLREWASHHAASNYLSYDPATQKFALPPEQAMGGEVGPRSDLYSLGAMLYEMVCGRPPFVGDDTVAVISQHVNTAPVSPTWHNPDCPPGLETLILRMLEKDPKKRPASATEVQ